MVLNIHSMDGALYLQDSYLKECDATVTSVKENKFITLDKTIFYPTSGGQPHDTGTMASNGKTFNVLYVGKFDGTISHQIEPESLLRVDDKVHCTLNWERRYKLMRMHTAAHLVSAVMYNESKVLITGNELQPDKSRIDFDFDKSDAQLFELFVKKANDAIKRSIPVKSYYLPREEAFKIPGIVKLAHVFPPDVKELHIVEIEGIDIEADAGTHVKNLAEIGEVIFLKTENKGKGRKRLYYTVR